MKEVDVMDFKVYFASEEPGGGATSWDHDDMIGASLS
jgi:hypothetical protein